MDAGDLIFYGFIAVSIVSSIVKATKKKTEANPVTGMPDFKGTSRKDIVKSILQEMMEKDDDFIPSNPQPVAQPKPIPVQKLQVEPLKRDSVASAFEKTRMATENSPRRESFIHPENSQSPTKLQIVENSNSVNLGLTEADELRKAIIYSEILRTKF